MLHPLTSSPGLVRNCALGPGDPVRREISFPSLTPRNTGSSAGACHWAAIRPTRWRTMTNVGILATRCARVFQIRSPQIKKRAQGRPGARCTRGLACKVANKKRTRAYRFSGSSPAFPAQWFTAYSVLSPVRPGLFVTVASVMRSIIANLTPANGASGPHDFTVRLTRCSSKAHPRPPLPAPTSVTMANAPSTSGRDSKE
jgi:hypothetical protein